MAVVSGEQNEGAQCQRWETERGTAEIGPIGTIRLACRLRISKDGIEDFNFWLRKHDYALFISVVPAAYAYGVGQHRRNNGDL